MGASGLTLGLLTTGVLAYVTYVIYKGFTGPLADVPGPFLARFSRVWLLKAVAGRKFDRLIIDLHKKYGPIVRISSNEVSIDDPDSAKVIYRIRDQLIKTDRYSAWSDPTDEHNMFTTPDVAHHTRRRKQIQILNNLDQLYAIEFQFDRATDILIDKFDSFADSNTTFDMTQWVQFYAFDAIAFLTFGQPLGFLTEAKDIGGIQATLHAYSRYGALVGIFAEFHPYIFRVLSALSPKGEVGVAAVVAFKDRLVEKHREKSTEQARLNIKAEVHQEGLRTDYLTSLFAKHMRDPSKFTMDDLNYHSFANVVAGAETTGITLCAALRYLVRHPSVLSKLRAELETFYVARTRTGHIQMKEVQDLPYLQAVLKETLRMFPGNGLNLSRIVPKGGLMLAGRHFPEGAQVGINAYSAHANKSIFGLDADEFRPERWTENTRETVNRMDAYFFAFGRGTRTCGGRHISLMEITKILPELLLRYDISYADVNHDWTYHNDWFVLQHDWQVKVTKRSLPIPTPTKPADVHAVSAVPMAETCTPHQALPMQTGGFTPVSLVDKMAGVQCEIVEVS